MNQIQIIGNLGSDPEKRDTDKGVVCNFSVGVSGHGDDGPMWVRVAVWGALAETCFQYLKKGRKVFAQGRLEYDPQTGGPAIFSRSKGGSGAIFAMTAQVVEFLDSPKTDEQARSV
jgi:single-stranded DNA-binding protein